MHRFNMALEDKQYFELREISFRRLQNTGKAISIAKLIREAVDKAIKAEKGKQ